MKTLLAVLALCVLAAPTAFAHSHLTMSVPKNKARLNGPPKQVILHFSEPVRLTELSIHNRGAAKRNWFVTLPTNVSADFAIAAPALPLGNYVVMWQALSDDGHVIKGTFSFMVMAKSE